MNKTTLIAGVAIGYVLGSRAGRERYEQIKSGAGRVAQDPRFQAAAGRAQEAAKDAVKDAVSHTISEVTSRTNG